MGKAMEIKIKIHGHQHYSEISGEALLWCQTAEKFEEGYLQVPCVVVRNDETGCVSAIPMVKQYYDVEIETIREEPDDTAHF